MKRFLCFEFLVVARTFPYFSIGINTDEFELCLWFFDFYIYFGDEKP